MNNNRKIILSIIFSITVFFVLINFKSYRQVLPGGDITPTIEGSKALFEGKNPYFKNHYVDKGKPMAMYPLPTYILMAPFVPFGPSYGAYLFFSLSTGLLVYTILVRRPVWMLLILISGVFFDSLWVIQFSPFIAALYLLPKISPLAIIKPQVGFPILLKHITPFNFKVILTIIVLSLLIMPDWIPSWWQSAQNYDGFIPLLTLPFGPILLLALIRWNNHDARFLFLFSLVPQRGLYDTLPLLLLAKTKQEMLILCLCSYIAFLIQPKLYFTPYSYWSSFLVYIPLTYFTLKRNPSWNQGNDQNKALQGTN